MKKTRKKMALFVVMVILILTLGGCKDTAGKVEGSTQGSEQVSTMSSETGTESVETGETESTAESEESTEESLESTEESMEESSTEESVTTESSEETVESTEESEESTEESFAKPSKDPGKEEKPSKEPTKESETKPSTTPSKEPEVVKPTTTPSKEPSKESEAPKPSVAPSQPSTQPSQPSQEHTHVYDGGTVTKEADCGNEGVRTYKCGCGATKTESIPATGVHGSTHMYYYNNVSCRTGSEYNEICDVCGKGVSSGYREADPHDYERVECYGGDCTHPSVYSNTCKNCGFEGPTEYGPVNPDNHDWWTDTSEVWDEENWVWIEVTGTYCTRCGVTK